MNPSSTPSCATLLRTTHVILPSRPYTPTDKGKVEAAVKYVKNNALKGKAFASLANTCAGGVSTSLTSVSTAQPSVRSHPLRGSRKGRPKPLAHPDLHGERTIRHRSNRSTRAFKSGLPNSAPSSAASVVGWGDTPVRAVLPSHDPNGKIAKPATGSKRAAPTQTMAVGLDITEKEVVTWALSQQL